MESRLQQRLKERLEKTNLVRMNERIAGLATGTVLEDDRIPSWVGDATLDFWKTSAESVESMPDHVPPDALNSWIEGLLSRFDITGRFFLATHLRISPWMECRAREEGGWVAQARTAVGDPWIFLSPSMDTVAAVTEHEYTYEFYVARRPAAAG